MKILELSLLALKELKDIKSELIRIKNEGISHIHYDVMDNIFVSNKAFEGEYLDLIKSLGFKISVHLMVEDIKSYVDKFLKYDIGYLTFHIEGKNEDEVVKLLEKIRSKNIKSGLAIKPKTDISILERYLDKIDLVTVMSVEPGFGGQEFIKSSVRKIKNINKRYKNLLVQIDGGINSSNIKKIRKYCDLIVSGTFLYKCDNLKY